MSSDDNDYDTPTSVEPPLIHVTFDEIMAAQPHRRGTEPPPLFEEAERIFAYHQGMLYEAKVGTGTPWSSLGTKSGGWLGAGAQSRNASQYNFHVIGTAGAALLYSLSGLEAEMG